MDSVLSINQILNFNFAPYMEGVGFVLLLLGGLSFLTGRVSGFIVAAIGYYLAYPFL